jgi:hypothetical protein
MGLDMYLEADIYIQNWKHNPPQEQYYTTLTNKLGQEIKLPCEPNTITCQIGYWRKANAIHAWFVKHVQNNDDKCQRTWVSREQLKALLDIVKLLLSSTKLIDGKVKNGSEIDFEKYSNHIPHDVIEDGKVIEDTKLAGRVLPTQDGFYFGNTDYDEDYLEDLKDTKKILEKAIKLDKTWAIYYRASW